MNTGPSARNPLKIKDFITGACGPPRIFDKPALRAPSAAVAGLYGFIQRTSQVIEIVGWHGFCEPRSYCNFFRGVAEAGHAQRRGPLKIERRTMTLKKRIAHAAAAFGLALLAASSGAAEFWTYVPGNGDLKVNNPNGGAGFAAVSVTGYTGSGGQFNGFFWAGGAMPADAFFRFFCVDLAQTANGGPNPYASAFLNDDDIRRLYDLAYPNKAAGDFWDNGAQTNFGVFGDATSAAAFQVALWNLFFDADLDLSAGAFKWTGAAGAPVATAAQALLDQVGTYSGDGYQRWTLYTFDSTRQQNYISATYRVPEPGTLGLVVLMLAALMLAARGRRA